MQHTAASKVTCCTARITHHLSPVFPQPCARQSQLTHKLETRAWRLLPKGSCAPTLHTWSEPCTSTIKRTGLVAALTVSLQPYWIKWYLDKVLQKYTAGRAGCRTAAKWQERHRGVRTELPRESQSNKVAIGIVFGRIGASPMPLKLGRWE